MNDSALDDMSEKEAVHCFNKLKVQMRSYSYYEKIHKNLKEVLPQ
jgi:hypothetical protein